MARCASFRKAGRASKIMDLYRIIDELVEERDRIQRIILSLEQMRDDGDVAVATPRKRRGRKGMDKSARQDVSERMKRYWARRRGMEVGEVPQSGNAPELPVI